MTDNVSKTETTNNNDKLLLITTSKLHDGIDLDPSMSNDKVEFSLSKDKKVYIHGDTNEGLTMKDKVK